MSDKDLKNYDNDKPKKGGIHFGSPNVPEGKAIEAIKDLFDGESHKEGEPYEFTYVVLGEVIKSAQPGIVFNWGCKKVGFGQITIVQREGKLYIDDECMSKEFIKEMFNYFIDEYYKKEVE